MSQKISKFVRLFFLFLLCNVVSADEPGKELLDKVDRLASFYDSDFAAEYTIVEDKPGEGRTKTVAAVFRRDSEQTYVIILTEPSISKGQGYLKLENTLWFYDPESRRFNYSSSRERFQNTNARNSDFTRSTLAEDYRVVSSEPVRLGRYNCSLLHLEAITDEVAYPYMRIWIDEDNLVRKTEDYSLSRQLLRTTAFPSYQQIGDDMYVPYQFVLVEQLLGAMVDGKFVNEKTQVTVSKVSLEPLADSVFTKRFLERVSR